MSKKDEALKLALEALAVKFSEGWHEGIKIDASDIMLLNDAAQALAEQPAQHHSKAWPPSHWTEYERGIAAAEREACAKVCESMRPSEQEFDQRFYTACTLNANAIRARGNT